MKILLTGPKGNLGSEILRQNRTHEIFELGRDDWDRLDPILSSGIDIVLHTAYDLKTALSDHPTDVMESNLMATLRLLERMKSHGTSRLIFLSSGAVYGESLRTTEETRCNPVSINGIVKLLNERLIEEYCPKSGIKHEICRVFNMYGGNDHFSILSYLKKAVESGKEFQLNNSGISQRDFIHVEDVAGIILKLTEMKHSFTHLNIGTGIATKISEIVSIVQNKHPEIRIKHNTVHESEYSRADIGKLERLLNYEFIDVKEFVSRNF